MFFLFSPHKFRVVEEERNRFDRMEGKASQWDKAETRLESKRKTRIEIESDGQIVIDS